MLTLTGIITGAVVLMQGALAPQGELSDAWKTLKANSREMIQTKMSALGVDVTGGGSDIELTIRNDGQTLLRDFDKWDLIVAYDPTTTSSGLRFVSLVYTDQASPASGQWSVPGIYLDASESDSEVFGPGVVDPGEEFVVRAKIGIPIGTPSTNTLLLAVANGVTLSAQFNN